MKGEKGVFHPSWCLMLPPRNQAVRKMDDQIVAGPDRGSAAHSVGVETHQGQRLSEKQSIGLFLERGLASPPPSRLRTGTTGCKWSNQPFNSSSIHTCGWFPTSQLGLQATAEFQAPGGKCAVTDFRAWPPGHCCWSNLFHTPSGTRSSLA